MPKKKFITYLSFSLLVLGFLGLVSSLNIAVQQNTDQSVRDKQEASLNTRLNVALVNEDNAVTVDGQIYQLGASYVKTIERDSSHNWSVVSRGTADKGLREGNYQLVLTIPNDFSSKILDINKVNVDQTTISYKINAAGNLQVENEANKVAKTMLADLNSQLVDMYMASILSNLYQAQQNVKDMSAGYSNHIFLFRSNLYQPFLEVRESFPHLVTQSDGSLTANTALRESLSSTIKLYEELEAAQATGKTNLEALMAKRAQGKETDAQFAAALFELDKAVLQQETDNLFKRVQETQETLSHQLRSEEPDTLTYASLIDKLNAQIDGLKEDIAIEQNRLEEQKKEIQQFAEKHLADHYQESLEQQTLKTLLTNSNLALGLEAYQTSLDALISDSLTDLPTFDVASLSEDLGLLDPATKDRIAFDSEFVTSQFAHLTTKTSEIDELKKLAADLKGYQTKDISFTAPTPDVTATISLDLPAEFTLESWSINGEVQTETSVNRPLKDINDVQVTVSYVKEEITTPAPVIPPADPTIPITSLPPTSTTDPSLIPVTDPTASNPPAVPNSPTTVTVTETKSVGIKVNNVTVASASFDWTAYREEQKAYREAQAAYAAKISDIVARYNRAGRLLELYYPRTESGERYSLTAKFLNTSTKDLLTELLVGAITANLSTYEDSVTSAQLLDKRLTELETLRTPLAENLASLEGQNKALVEEIGNQLTFLTSLQAQMKTSTDLLQAQNTQTADLDNDLSQLGTELSALMGNTETVKQTSNHNLEELNSVNAIFTGFNQDIRQVQTNTDQLSQDTTQLMTAFETELAETGDFATSFSSVLDNAYSNGVPNEILLSFLSNPLRESSSSVKATVNVYRPFTWILLLEMVALFTAYLFTTYKGFTISQDKFKLNPFLRTDLMRVLLTTGLSLVSGLTLGILSGRQLTISAELFPSWVLMISLYSLLLVQGQYFLLKLSKGIGMGISFFTIISFVYLSNAIGTTASLTGLASVLKQTNVLSLLENSLSHYFDGQPATILFIALTLLAGLAFALVNVWFNGITWFKEKEA